MQWLLETKAVQIFLFNPNKNLKGSNNNGGSIGFYYPTFGALLEFVEEAL